MAPTSTLSTMCIRYSPPESPPLRRARAGLFEHVGRRDADVEREDGDEQREPGPRQPQVGHDEKLQRVDEAPPDVQPRLAPRLGPLDEAPPVRVKVGDVERPEQPDDDE